MSRENQIKKLEDLGYEVIGETITKKDREQTPLHIANLTEQKAIIPLYSNRNLEALRFSIELKEICKEKGWKYLENKERLGAAYNFLNSMEEEISSIKKRLSGD